MEMVTKIFEVSYPKTIVLGWTSNEDTAHINAADMSYGAKMSKTTWANESRELIKVVERG